MNFNFWYCYSIYPKNYQNKDRTYAMNEN